MSDDGSIAFVTLAGGSIVTQMEKKIYSSNQNREAVLFHFFKFWLSVFKIPCYFMAHESLFKIITLYHF